MPTPVRVQTAGSDWGSSLASQVQAFSSASAAGNLLIAVVSTSQGATLSSISDSSGTNVWTIAYNHVFTHNASNVIAVAYCANAASATTVTAGLSAASYGGMRIAEYGGIAATNALDVAASNDPDGYATTLTIPLSTTFPGELLLAAVAVPGSFGTLTADTGFVTLTGTASQVLGEDAVAATSGSHPVTATLDAAYQAVGWYGAFRDTGQHMVLSSPASVISSTTGNTLTLKGSNTAWTSGTTFTPSAGTVTATSVNAGTQVATLTYTAPATAQTVTLTDSTDALSATLPVAAAATSVTLAGPTTGYPSVASTPFTVALSPVGGAVGGTVTVTPASTGGGDTFSPPTASLTTASPTATFALTPGVGVGARTVSVANTGGLTDGAPLVYTTISRNIPTLGPIWFLPKYQTCSVEVRFAGDDNLNANLAIAYRKHGASTWRNLTNPLPPWRIGTQNAYPVTAVTNASPPVVTVSTAGGDPGYAVGQWVRVWNVGGATGVNGTFKVASVPTTGQFTVTNLDGSAVAAPGVWTSGGKVGVWETVRAWYYDLFYLAALGATSAQSYDVQIVLTDPDGYSGTDLVNVNSWNSTDKSVVTTQSVTPVLSAGNTVATLTIADAFSTLPDAIPDPTTLAPTRFVDGHNGLDTNTGLSLAAAWKTLAHACAVAPANAVVGVRAGYFYTFGVAATPADGVRFVPVDGSGACTPAVLPITLTDEIHGNDTFKRAAFANEGSRAVVDSGLMTIPAGATPNADGGRTEVAGPWVPVNVGGVADPTRTFKVYKWANYPFPQPYATPFGFSATRTGEPQWLQAWPAYATPWGVPTTATPPGPDGLGYNDADGAAWAEMVHEPRQYQFGSISPGLVQAALANPTVAPTLVAGTPTALANPGGAPVAGATTPFNIYYGAGNTYHPALDSSTAYAVQYAWGNQAGWTAASAAATLATSSGWTVWNGSSSTSHYQGYTTFEAAPAGTTRLGIFVKGALVQTIANPSTGSVSTFVVSGPPLPGALAAPTANTTAATPLAAGTYTGAYTYRSLAGESLLSPTQTVTITLGQYIAASTGACPANTRTIGWYLGTAPGGSTLAGVTGTAAATTQATLAVAGSAAVAVAPTSNTTAATTTDVYVRVPTLTTGPGTGGLPEQDPNTLYITMQLQDSNGTPSVTLTGKDQRVSGLELRASAIGAMSTARNSVVDWCLFADCYLPVTLRGDSTATPNVYGDLCTVQNNYFHATLKWSTDQNDRSQVPWNQTKGLWGGATQDAAIEMYGGGSRPVVRYNTIVGHHDTAYIESGFDRYQAYGWDFYLNLVEQHADDGPEPGLDSMNVAIFHNWIANTLTGVSINGTSYGPVWFIRNQIWEYGSLGQPVDYTLPSGTQVSFPGGNGIKWGDGWKLYPRLYALGNTWYSDCSRTVTDLFGDTFLSDVSGAYPSAGSYPASFYVRNNIWAATFGLGLIGQGYDPDLPFLLYDSDYNAWYDPFDGSGAWVRWAGVNQTTIAGYRAASAAAGSAQDLHSQPWGTGSFADDPRGQWAAPASGDLSLAAGSGFAGAGVVVGGIADQALAPGADLWASGGGYYGSVPSLGAVDATILAILSSLRTLLGVGQ